MRWGAAAWLSVWFKAQANSFVCRHPIIRSMRLIIRACQCYLQRGKSVHALEIDSLVMMLIVLLEIVPDSVLRG